MCEVLLKLTLHAFSQGSAKHLLFEFDIHKRLATRVHLIMARQTKNQKLKFHSNFINDIGSYVSFWSLNAHMKWCCALFYPVSHSRHTAITEIISFIIK